MRKSTSSHRPKQRPVRKANGPESDHVCILPVAAESDHVCILPVASIRPSPENATLYRPVDPKDPDIRALARSIRHHGLQEPIVVTGDGYILSGHRRYAACKLAGLDEVRCRVLPIRREDDIDRFVVLLREHNRQRNKTFSEKVREEVVSADPEEAYQSLIRHRQTPALDVDTIALRGKKRRAEISEAKTPFLEAVQAILKERRKFWPLSDRQIHYALLNDPPLIHASKPNSIYSNTSRCYHRLTDLLTRARLVGLIRMNAIADETRPVLTWNIFQDVQQFVREEISGFLKHYWRDLMQSQPNHVEIVGEKLTIASIIKPVAAQYCIPTTIGRGFCSLPPRAAIAERYENSGKDRLILLLLSDFDPDGEEIAHSLARSLRDDFEIGGSVEAVKVALTAEQVDTMRLPPALKAKTKSKNYRRFAAAHGNDVYELEALEPTTLQRLLTEAIDSVIDVEAFNRELDQEKQDATQLEATRREVYKTLVDLVPDGEDATGDE